MQISRISGDWRQNCTGPYYDHCNHSCVHHVTALQYIPVFAHIILCFFLWINVAFSVNLCLRFQFPTPVFAKFIHIVWRWFGGSACNDPWMAQGVYCRIPLFSIHHEQALNQVLGRWKDKLKESKCYANLLNMKNMVDQMVLLLIHFHQLCPNTPQNYKIIKNRHSTRWVYYLKLIQFPNFWEASRCHLQGNRMCVGQRHSSCDPVGYVTWEELQGDGWNLHSLVSVLRDWVGCFLWIWMASFIFLLQVLSFLSNILLLSIFTPWPLAGILWMFCYGCYVACSSPFHITIPTIMIISPIFTEWWTCKSKL